jgi:DNA-binding transcriptional ArsR family regulator
MHRYLRIVDLKPRYIDDPRALRALAHPIRQQILRRLTREGPATSAMLARELNADRGATSFHLRQLGSYGFVAVDEERSVGRRKFWRRVPDDLRFPSDPDGPLAEEGAAVVSSLWEDSLVALARFYREGDRWREEAQLSHSDLRLTREELRSFGEEYLALVRRYLRPAEEAPDGARSVTALFAAFPNPAAP